MRIRLILKHPNGESTYFWRDVDRPYLGVPRVGEWVFIFDDLRYKTTVDLVEHRNDGVVELWLDVKYMHPSDVEDLRDGPWVAGSLPPSYDVEWG